MKVHANAPLGPKGRLTMVLRVLELGWSLAHAAEAAGVSGRTGSKWVRRYQAGGEAGLLDRSSAPSSISHRTPEELVEAIVVLRKLRMTGAEIATVLSMALSTVSAVLLRVGLGKLSRLEPPEPPNRYERRHPGELLHVDVKKLGSTTRPAWPTSKCSNDEKATTAVGFLQRAIAFYARHGITVERLMTDNVRPTAPPSTPSPAARSASATSAPGPTGRAPTAKPNASSAPSSPAGPTA